MAPVLRSILTFGVRYGIIQVHDGRNLWHTLRSECLLVGGKMEKLYIQDLKIKKVRHLENIDIPISETDIKHLIFTGKNGSGKTSLLDALSAFLHSVSTSNIIFEAPKSIAILSDALMRARQEGKSENEIKSLDDDLKLNEKWLAEALNGLEIRFNYPLDGLASAFQRGEFILAYYGANRIFTATIPKHIEKIDLKESYTIKENPSNDFIKYLADLKVTQALAITGNKPEKADRINDWFVQFENLLKKIFQDNSLKLVFDEDTFKFAIYEYGKEPFDFNSLSSGYAAILNIVVDMIIRMEKKADDSFIFDMPGIVLIDEIETHLHIEMQKNILGLLTGIFPNIQFIISTHSPFILNSLDNVVIYDLEKKMLVGDGLTDISYSGVVKGYFGADELSDTLKSKFERYKALTKKKDLSDEEFCEIAQLELYLKEIPDYLNLDISTEFQRLKLEFDMREDLQ